MTDNINLQTLKEIEKTRRLQLLFFIVVISSITIVLSIAIFSYEFSDYHINISSDSETYNITKIIMDSAVKISDKQDYTYKELLACQTELDFYKGNSDFRKNN